VKSPSSPVKSLPERGWRLYSVLSKIVQDGEVIKGAEVGVALLQRKRLQVTIEERMGR